MKHFRLCAAIGFPVVVTIGMRLTESSGLGEMLVASCLLGFLIGLIFYLWQMADRSKARRLGPLHPNALPVSPTVAWLIGPAIALPVLLGISRGVYHAFDGRFIGVALASVVCLALFYWLGDRPIRFMQELLLAGLSVSPADRRTHTRFPGRPDLAKLAVVLLVALLVPAYLSNAWAIVFVLILCTLELRRSISPLLRYGTWQTVLSALWMRAVKAAFEYLDYSPHDQYHWRPPEPLRKRQTTLMLLLFSFDFALITGLTYYCPWEPFAALFVPGFQSNFLMIPQYSLADYHWALAPFQLVHQADPVAGYLVCFLVALVLFFVLPPLVLFLVYVERLTELEILAQELKRERH